MGPIERAMQGKNKGDMRPSVMSYSPEELEAKQDVSRVTDIADLLSNLIPGKAAAGLGMTATRQALRESLSNPSWLRAEAERGVAKGSPVAEKLMEKLMALDQRGTRMGSDALMLEGGVAGAARQQAPEEAFALRQALMKELYGQPKPQLSGQQLDLPLK